MDMIERLSLLVGWYSVQISSVHEFSVHLSGSIEKMRREPESICIDVNKSASLFYGPFSVDLHTVFDLSTSLGLLLVMELSHSHPWYSMREIHHRESQCQLQNPQKTNEMMNESCDYNLSNDRFC